mmetsp:Transcript_15002/g.25799  ORF Transcript_15002/g.25799 Transcript_15002/m.25799 type:complete len:309 (+) Transcript_15002:805-1731(+)
MEASWRCNECTTPSVAAVSSVRRRGAALPDDVARSSLSFGSRLPARRRAARRAIFEALPHASGSFSMEARAAASNSMVTAARRVASSGGTRTRGRRGALESLVASVVVLVTVGGVADDDVDDDDDDDESCTEDESAEQSTNNNNDNNSNNSENDDKSLSKKSKRAKRTHKSSESRRKTKRKAFRGGLDDDDWKLLAPVIQPQRASADEVLQHVSHSVHSLFVVGDACTIVDESGESRATLRAGELFGVSSWLLRRPSFLSLTTLRDQEYSTISIDQLQTLLESSPALAARVYYHMALVLLDQLSRLLE